MDEATGEAARTGVDTGADAGAGTGEGDNRGVDGSAGVAVGVGIGLRDLTGVALTTGRMMLAAPTGADLDAITLICQDPDVLAWNRIPSPYTREHAELFLREDVAAGAAAGTGAVFGMYHAVSAQLLGIVALHAITAPAARDGAQAEIVYLTAPSARRQGYCTEAVRAVCRWAFAELRLERLEWSAFAGNDASRRVAEKTGFTFEGTLRSRAVHRGARTDVWLGSLLPGEAV